MPPPRLELIHGEPSLPLRSDCVRAWLTPRGGMLGPVEFTLPNGRRVAPYSLAPWTPPELDPSHPPLLQILRGDFFCFPFGETPGVPEPHGPTANAGWQIAAATGDSAELTLTAAAPACRVRKRLRLRPGETTLYQEHVLVAEGTFNYGHHPILHIPEGVTAEVRTSVFGFGGVYPGHAHRPVGERGALAPGARFVSLGAVPLATGGLTSLRRYPARPATEDIVMLAAFPASYAWTALTLDGYVWFALRRTSDFPSTLFWMSDGGRQAAPWQGRHGRRIGIEDVYSYFCDGADVSARDLLAAEGVPTARTFHPAAPVRLPHVQGVVQVPADFGGVASLGPDSSDPWRAVLRGESGEHVVFPLDWTFLDA